MKSFTPIIVVLFLAGSTSIAQAQLGRAVREGAEAVIKRAFSKGGREVGEESAETAAKGGLRSIARRSVQESTTTLAERNFVGMSDDAARAFAAHGNAVAAPLLQQFGDDGVRAIAKLTPQNARRVAMMADDLAATGKGSEFMQVLTTHGDAAADWIWTNKGSLAVGTVAVAFLANPDPFLAKGGELTTTIVETASKEIARPLIEHGISELGETTRAVAPAMVSQVVAPVATALPWTAFILLGSTFVGIWVFWRLEGWRPFLQLLATTKRLQE